MESVGTRRVMASPRPSMGRIPGATPRDRSGTTYPVRDESPAFGAVGVPGWLLAAAAERAISDLDYGPRSSRRVVTRGAVICPACGLRRSVTGLCECNGG